MTTIVRDRHGPIRNFFGPPRTRSETIFGLLGGALVIGLLVAHIGRTGGWHGRSPMQAVVLAVMLFDLVGGIMTISAATANRWYHRPGLAARRFRLAFLAAHALLYLVPAALVFHTGWTWAVANIGFLLGAGAAVEFSPFDVKRLLALGLTLAAVLVNLTWLPVPNPLGWVSVLLFVKVLVCFLVPQTSTA